MPVDHGRRPGCTENRRLQKMLLKCRLLGRDRLLKHFCLHWKLYNRKSSKNQRINLPFSWGLHPCKYLHDDAMESRRVGDRGIGSENVVEMPLIRPRSACKIFYLHWKYFTTENLLSRLTLRNTTMPHDRLARGKGMSPPQPPRLSRLLSENAIQVAHCCRSLVCSYSNVNNITPAVDAERRLKIEARDPWVRHHDDNVRNTAESRSSFF